MGELSQLAPLIVAFAAALVVIACLYAVESTKPQRPTIVHRDSRPPFEEPTPTSPAQQMVEAVFDSKERNPTDAT